jgi:peptidoglycan/LPS O-acetylase OafA/YrhL
MPELGVCGPWLGSGVQVMNVVKSRTRSQSGGRDATTAGSLTHTQDSALPPGPRPDHMPQLDGLRACAAMAVVFVHTTQLGSPWPAVAWWGGAGVWLFFVLSGFLITGILLGARSQAEAVGEPLARVWGAFWVRRALRIFPLYYAALAAVAAAGWSRQELPWFAAYLGNVWLVLPDHWSGTLAHFWSLCVEEQFYLLWPPLCLWLPRAALIRVAVVAVVMGPVARLALPIAGLPKGALFLTPSCLDALGLGAVLAISRRTPPGWVAAVGAAVAEVCAIAEGAGITSLPILVDWRPGFAIASWWLVGRASVGFGGIAGRMLGSRPLRYVGQISYGVYVIHALISPFCLGFHHRFGTSLGFPHRNGIAQFAYVTALTLAFASLSWYRFEAPLNNLKRFIPYVRRRGTTPS